MLGARAAFRFPRTRSRHENIVRVVPHPAVCPAPARVPAGPDVALAYRLVPRLEEVQEGTARRTVRQGLRLRQAVTVPRRASRRPAAWAPRLEPVRAVLQGRPRFRSIHPLTAGCPAGPSRRASPGRRKAVASTAFPPSANQKAVFRKRVGAGEAGKPSSAAFRHRRPARFQFRKRQSARRAFSASVRRVPPIKKGIVRVPYNPFSVCWFRRKPRPRTYPCGAGCLHAGAARRVRTRCSGAGLRPTRGCRRRCRERAGPWRGAAKTPWRRCG